MGVVLILNYLNVSTKEIGMHKILLLSITLTGSSLAGCMSTGPMHGTSRDGMQMVAAWKNPDYGPMTASDYTHVARHAEWCRQMAHNQLSGPVESAATMGINGAIAGGIGVGGGAVLGGAGTMAMMGPYGAAAGGAQGIVGGLQVHSGATASLTGSCTARNLEDARSRREGVHAAPVYVRSRNRSDRLPRWVVPDGAAPQYQNDVAEDVDGVIMPPPEPR